MRAIVAALLLASCAPTVLRTPTGVRLRLEQAPLAGRIGLWEYAVWSGEIVGVWMRARPQLDERAVWNLIAATEAILVGRAKFDATGAAVELRGVSYPHLPAIGLVTRNGSGGFDRGIVASLWKHELSHVIACRLLAVCGMAKSHALFVEVGAP